jgi:predicted TPR repeat methyltransferase
MTTDPTHRNQVAYDQIAKSFAERNADMLPYLIEQAERLLDSLRRSGRAAQFMLDLGCGAGRDAAWLEDHGARMLGADLSMGMLAEAHQRVRGPLCQLDMRFLPHPGGVFAAVWCQAALLHLPKVVAPAALAEARRVLMPAGLLHVSVQKGDSEGFETRPYEPAERYYAHYQPEELTALLHSAGFEIITQGQSEARRTWLWVMAQARD